MIYNNRNLINDTTESQKEKKGPILKLSTVSQKVWITYTSQFFVHEHGEVF